MVDCEIPHQLQWNEIFFTKVWKPLSNMCFKNLEGKPERESPKKIISASGGLVLLQMVSEPDTGRCASEDARPPKGWIVRSHIGCRGTKHSL